MHSIWLLYFSEFPYPINVKPAEDKWNPDYKQDGVKFKIEKKKTMLTTNAEIIVATEAPINPSHVFFGDSLINGVLPKKKPTT